MAEHVARTSSRVRSMRAESTCSRRGRLVEGDEQRVDGAERVRPQELRGLDVDDVVGAVELVEPAQHGRHLAHRTAPLVPGHAGPATAQRPPRHPVHDEPVRAQLAAVGLDGRVADLGGEQWADGGLAPQPLVGLAVDPDHIAIREPDLVGDAGGPLEGQVERKARFLQGSTGAGEREGVTHGSSCRGPIASLTTALRDRRLTAMSRTAHAAVRARPRSGGHLGVTSRPTPWGWAPGRRAGRRANACRCGR